MRIIMKHVDEILEKFDVVVMQDLVIQVLGDKMQHQIVQHHVGMEDELTTGQLLVVQGERVTVILLRNHHDSVDHVLLRVPVLQE